jgi:AcrR family transcriptional regulator
MAVDTKEQILDAAERFFAESGIEAVPLRRIIAEAGVNTAAIHYHFGSKEGVVRAVFARRFDPLNRERLSMLDEAERRARGKPLPVEEVLYAVVAPALRLRQSNTSGSQFCRLVGRVFTERPGYLKVIFNDVFKEMERRFDAALTKSLPHLNEVDRAWRKQLAIGSLVHIMREQEFICGSTGGLCDFSDVDGAIERIVLFMAAGMKAPVTKTRSKAGVSHRRNGLARRVTP